MSRLRATGSWISGEGRRVGLVTRSPVESGRRGDYLRVLDASCRDADLGGYAAVICEAAHAPVPLETAVGGLGDLSFLREGQIATVEPASGRVHVVYRPESKHNFLFATERCNSRCVMCSQPPRDIDDRNAAAELLRVIELIPDHPEHLGITGGEPTLLGDGLVRVVGALGARLPNTAVTMLSNARTYSDESFVRALAATNHPRFLTSVPLYGPTASDHDFVVQSRGAFDQTISGLYNAARNRLAVELRVVLHKQTVPLLSEIVEFAYRNLPFVQHIAFMGLEEMGYARANEELLWVDPEAYGEELDAAVRACWYRRLPASIYNLPLCLVPEPLWSFARQSISDFKNVFQEGCEVCSLKERCAGFFQSSALRYKTRVRPFSATC